MRKKTVLALLLIFALLPLSSCNKKSEDATISASTSEQTTPENTPLSPAKTADIVNSAIMRAKESYNSYKLTGKIIDELTVEKIREEEEYYDKTEADVTCIIINRLDGSLSASETVSMPSYRVPGTTKSYLKDGIYYITDGETNIKISEKEISSTPLSAYVICDSLAEVFCEYDASYFEACTGFTENEDGSRYIEFTLPAEKTEELYADVICSYKTEYGAGYIKAEGTDIKITVDKDGNLIGLDEKISTQIAFSQGEDIILAKLIIYSSAVYLDINSTSLAAEPIEGYESFPEYS